MEYQAFEFPLEIQEEVDDLGLMEAANQFNYIPEKIVFYCPLDRGYTTVLLSDDYECQYRQLVCWCAYARYWYYVVGKPKFHDMEYDFMERLVKKFEEVCGVSNPYSPTTQPGSDISFYYPQNIQQEFLRTPLDWLE